MWVLFVAPFFALTQMRKNFSDLYNKFPIFGVAARKLVVISHAPCAKRTRTNNLRLIIHWGSFP